MEATYKERYEEMLLQAVGTGKQILGDMMKAVPYMNFIGKCETKYETRYYYEYCGQYYYESEFARQMRLTIRKNKFRGKK